MRRILNQAANAAAKHKGSIFQILCGRYVPRLGHKQTIGVSKASKQKRSRKMILQLGRLGLPDRIEPISSHHGMIAISDWHDFRGAGRATCQIPGTARSTNCDRRGIRSVSHLEKSKRPDRVFIFEARQT
jgi:hypothetical protein